MSEASVAFVGELESALVLVDSGLAAQDETPIASAMVSPDFIAFRKLKLFSR